MRLVYCVLTLIFVDGTVAFIIIGPAAPLVAPLGGFVVLLCYVRTSLDTEKIKVEWRKTDSETLVQLFLDGEIRAEAQHKDYHGRAHFFTEEIHHGNFSLRLDDLKAGDSGVYRCKVYSQRDSDKTLVELKVVEPPLVFGSDESISASVGEDVTLNCSVDSHISPEHIEEVSWKKTDGDILVLLFQNNETLSDSSDERFRDRVEFFPEEIPKGNFSLRLKRVRIGDKGVYMCLVFAGGASANATAELGRLGFSDSVIMLMTFCGIGSAAGHFFHLLGCCKSKNGGISLCLQIGLFIGPNITMLLSLIIWHAIEGSLCETVPCCVFYIMGPLRMLWVTPYTGFPNKFRKIFLTSHADHVAFMVTMYSVILVKHFQKIDTAIKTAAFGLLVLMFLLFIARLIKENLLSEVSNSRIYCAGQELVLASSFSVLPSLQLALLLYYCFGNSAAFAVLPVLPACHLVSLCCCERANQCLNFLTKLIWLTVIAMGGVMVYLYLGNKEDVTGLFCVAGFVQAFWVLMFSKVPAYHTNFKKRKVLFVFGSAGLVLVNSAALMTELIAIAVRGERLLGDLRRVLFPSEGLFTVVLLLLSLFAPWKTESSQMSEDSETGYTSVPRNTGKQRTEESCEMETVGGVTGNTKGTRLSSENVMVPAGFEED